MKAVQTQDFAKHNLPKEAWRTPEQVEVVRNRYFNINRCCEKAEPMNCVCTFSCDCPVHGITHKGTHD